MSKLMKSLQRERDALRRRRELALNRRRGYESKLNATRARLKEAERELRAAKRAVLVGGPARLEEEQESALVRELTGLPIEEAALADVIDAEDKHIAEVDAGLRATEVEIINAQQDAVEVSLLAARLEELRLRLELAELRARMADLLAAWEAEERGRRALGDSTGRPHPADTPDHYSRDAFGRQRTPDQTREALAARITELQERLNGAKG